MFGHIFFSLVTAPATRGLLTIRYFWSTILLYLDWASFWNNCSVIELHWICNQDISSQYGCTRYFLCKLRRRFMQYCLCKHPVWLRSWYPEDQAKTNFPTLKDCLRNLSWTYVNCCCSLKCIYTEKKKIKCCSQTPKCLWFMIMNNLCWYTYYLETRFVCFLYTLWIVEFYICSRRLFFFIFHKLLCSSDQECKYYLNLNIFFS